jgi:hypothetical protein
MRKDSTWCVSYECGRGHVTQNMSGFKEKTGFMVESDKMVPQTYSPRSRIVPTM